MSDSPEVIRTKSNDSLDTVDSDASSSNSSSRGLMARLSVMMFIEYWTLGLWAVTFGTYLAANTGKLGSGIYEPGFIGFTATTSAIGGLISPLLIGFISDRYFSTQKLITLLHVGAGLAVWSLYNSQTQAGFFWGMLIYFQCFVPTITLTNALSLRHLKNVDKEFSLVRIYGTFGWIVAGLFVGFGWPSIMGQSIEATRIPLMLSAISHAVMAIYSLTLPKTPPEVAPSKSGAGAKSVGWHRQLWQSTLWRNRPFMLFLLFSLFACLPSMAYTTFSNPFLNDLGYASAAGKLTLGQCSEIACLFFMSLLVRKLGLKRLMLVGILAWAVRYTLLAVGAVYGSAVAIYLAILVHGPCYVFIYVAGQLYIDQLASKTNRGTAQGLLTLATTGIGHLLGAILCGYLQRRYLTPIDSVVASSQWAIFWLVPAALCFIAALLFQFAFREPNKPVELRADELPASPAEALAEPPHR